MGVVGHTGHILALAVSSDGEFLVSEAGIQLELSKRVVVV